MPTIFNAFDLNNDKTLSVHEFLETIRGDISDRRMDIVEHAFNSIAPGGELEMMEIKSAFHADKHPDVLSGKRQAQQVLVEFLETFEQSLHLMER